MEHNRLDFIDEKKAEHSPRKWIHIVCRSGSQNTLEKYNHESREWITLANFLHPKKENLVDIDQLFYSEKRQKLCLLRNSENFTLFSEIEYDMIHVNSKYREKNFRNESSRNKKSFIMEYRRRKMNRWSVKKRSNKVKTKTQPKHDKKKLTEVFYIIDRPNTLMKYRIQASLNYVPFNDTIYVTGGTPNSLGVSRYNNPMCLKLKEVEFEVKYDDLETTFQHNKKCRSNKNYSLSKWRKANNDMPSRISGPTTNFGKYMFFVGGREYVGFESRRVEMHDTEHGTTYSLKSTNYTHCGLGNCLIYRGRYLFVFGGYRSKQKAADDSSFGLGGSEKTVQMEEKKKDASEYVDLGENLEALKDWSYTEKQMQWKLVNFSNDFPFLSPMLTTSMDEYIYMIGRNENKKIAFVRFNPLPSSSPIVWEILPAPTISAVYAMCQCPNIYERKKKTKL
jgi:hypothetical protein